MMMMIIVCLFFAATAWDNYDVAIETLDGKNTLHLTVGICYQKMIQSKKSHHAM